MFKIINRTLLVIFIAYSYTAISDDNVTINGIVDKHETKITIKNNGIKVYTHKRIILYNDNVQEDNRIVLINSKNESSKLINAEIRDINNVLIRKIKTSDFIAMIDLGTFSSDAHYKSYTFSNLTYPCIIDIAYEYTFDYLLNIPFWKPVSDYNIQVNEASLEILVAGDAGFRYRELNMPTTCEIKNTNIGKLYTWQIHNFKPLQEDKFSDPNDLPFPALLLAPNDLNYDGYSGKFNTWADLGKWISLLNEGRDILHEDFKAKIHHIASQYSNKYDIVKALYDYLQDNTRYVSIQYGIGGYQPFPASDVAEKGYGDCKALSNFMYSVLKEVGIKSFYTLVEAGSPKDIYYDFPSSQFNHVILCIPMESDTIWLENTNQNMPFAFIGSFTEDRHVLVIDGDSSYIAVTKKYKKAENHESSYAEYFVAADGNATLSLDIEKYGLQLEDLYWQCTQYTNNEKYIFLSNYFPFKNYALDKYNLELHNEVHPYISLHCKISLHNYAVPIGDKLILPLNQLQKIPYSFTSDTMRNYDFYQAQDYVQIDTFVYNIPENYTIESIPTMYNDSTYFSSYYSGWYIKDGRIIFIRKFEVNKMSIPLQDFTIVKKYYKNLISNDNPNIILKETTPVSKQ